MQIIQSKSNYVEKIIRDKDGRLLRATFYVYENGGRIKARLVDFVYITAGIISGSISKLNGFVNEKISELKSVLNFSPFSINYFLSSIYSTGSKPRAPTF